MLAGGQCQGLHRTHHDGDVFWMCDACHKQANGKQPNAMPTTVPVAEAERQRQGGNEEDDAGVPVEDTPLAQAEATETDNSQCMSRCCSIA